MAIQTSVGSPGTVSAASGGYTYAINNLSTTPQNILPVDPQRYLITVHNPGAVDAFFAPVSAQNTGADVALAPTPSALGGCYRIFANGGTLVISGECQKAWQALSASGSGNPLTVSISRIG